MMKMFPVIDLVATGENITRLRKDRGLTVRDLQDWFGFEEPQAIYKWQKGKSLPTVDNLYALGALLDVPLEEILVPCKPKLNIVKNGQQDVSCCPPLLPGSFEYGRNPAHATIFSVNLLLNLDPNSVGVRPGIRSNHLDTRKTGVNNSRWL